MNPFMNCIHIRTLVIMVIIFIVHWINCVAANLILAPDVENSSGRNITKILDEFFAQGKYDKRVRPFYGGPPVEVGVTMHIISISSVSEVQMDFTSDFYFRQKWKDNRLSFTPQGSITQLVVGAEVAKKIWVPDTFFANEKIASFHDATTPNTFLRIDQHGLVYRSIRLTVTASCPMNLQYFPMDRQLCTIEIESYGYSMADIIYIWGIGPGSVGMAPGLELPQFKVVGHKQSTKLEVLSTGNYSRLVCEIQFVRSMGYYLIQIYIPASLIVFISWVSFWLHRNATPARVALGVTTVLTMTTLMSSTNAALPKISYVKSIDVFLGTCFVMVFASLLEYALVGYLGKRIAMRKTRTQQLAKLAQEHRNRCAAAAAAAAAAETGGVLVTTDGGGGDRSPYIGSLTSGPVLCPPSMESTTLPRPGMYRYVPVPEVRLKMTDTKTYAKPMTAIEHTYNGSGGGHEGRVQLAPEPETPSTPANTPFGCKNPNKLLGVSPSDIDKYSRVVFPVCFVCFNLMYWIIYLHISDELTEDLVPAP